MSNQIEDILNDNITLKKSLQLERNNKDKIDKQLK
jgi:hypothetical protein